MVQVVWDLRTIKKKVCKASMKASSKYALYESYLKTC